MPSVKGTASVADSRARQKALKKTKFPRNFGKTVSLENVNKAVITQWIEQKITSILGFEDEIVSSTAINLFLPSDNASPDPKKAQLDLAGFLGDQAVSFSAELWKLMLEAQTSNSGIPQTLLEKKKKEMTERMSRSKQDEGDKERIVPVNDVSETNRSRIRNDKQRIYSSSESNLRGSGSSNKQDNKSDKNTTDKFGRVYPPHRPSNANKSSSRSRYNRNHPDVSETSRRKNCRSRSRSRSRDMHERDSGYRRRSEDRNNGRRRSDDRRYDSDYRDNRSGYHHQEHRRRNDCFDRNNYYGENLRERYDDYDREIHHLRRRLSQLKNHYSERDLKTKNQHIHGIDDEIKYVEDKIYYLERRRRKSTSSRDNYNDSRRYRSRSPSQDYRRSRSGRRKRRKRTHSESSNSVRSNPDDYSMDSSSSKREDNSSYILSPSRNRKSHDRDSTKVKNRRRSRSFSSSERSEQSS